MPSPPVSAANTSGRQPAAVSRLRIIVLGYIVRGPLGGFASYHLQHVMGLSRLGHDVYFVEDSDNYASCYDPFRDITDTNPAYGLRFMGRVFDRVGLGDHWVYYDAHTSRWLGPCAERILEILATADLLINLGGVNPLRPWHMQIPVRAFIDLDPVFTQVRHLTNPSARDRALQHTAFLTIGENIGNQSTIPQDGLPWQTTRQPVVLDAWPVTPGPEDGKFTTVMLWNSYPAAEHDGIRYGMKSESFGPYLDLPERAGPIFELAVGSPSAPWALLRSKGWAVRDSREPTRDPWRYQCYIQESKAEFSVAKHGYVISHSGWFSDRSVAYLVSARPVILQETGFSDWLQTGSGIIPFSTPEEALAGIDEINRRYQFHCAAARAIAEEYFDSRKVLSRLVECALNPAPAPGTDGLTSNVTLHASNQSEDQTAFRVNTR